MKDINFNNVSFYSPLIRDYLNGELKKKGVISWDYSESQILKNIQNRRFSIGSRALLVSAIRSQYQNLNLTELEEINLVTLSKENCYTVTTGHQLTLLGGPQFFYTKILDVINLCKRLTEKTDSTLVPIFWMASEDHDYKEISCVNLFGKKICCPGENKGPVGRIPTSYFKEFLSEVNEILGDNDRVLKVKEIINSCYKEGKTLASATRDLVRALFSEEGLLVVDGDDKALKAEFVPFVLKEVEEKTTYNEVSKQIKMLEGYKIQVSPREINLFYIQDEIRKRLVEDSNISVLDEDISWSEIDFTQYVNEYPEQFSPNAILRPLYQEVILPNVAYVGGAGEIAYWLELESMFKAFKVDFPLPLVRTSYFSIPKKLLNWLNENQFEFEELFQEDHVLEKKYLSLNAKDELSFETEMNSLQEFYKELLVKGTQIDPQLEKVVQGEEKRAIAALANVEKRFANAEKRKHEVGINKLLKIKSKAFPSGKAMERVDSFLPLWNDGVLDILKSDNAFKNQILLITY